jgi:hypothetical protein
VSFPKIRDITVDILTRCGISSPPVDLDLLVARFKARVVKSSHVAESALLRTREGWTIKVNREFRQERAAFRIAHELAHIYWSYPRNHQGDPSLGGKLEHYCSKFASLLLCPHQWLVRDAPEADYDLAALKQIYATVSHEALSIRLSYLTPMVVTIFDNGQLYRRFSSPGLGYPPGGQGPETEIREAVDIYGKTREKYGTLKWGGKERKVRVRGYPVFDGSFRRIILVTTPAVAESLEEDPGYQDDMPYPFPEY